MGQDSLIHKGQAREIWLANSALERGDLKRVDSLMRFYTWDQVAALEGKDQAYGMKMLAISAYYQESFKLSNAYYSILLGLPYLDADAELKADCFNNRGVNYEIMGLLDSAYVNYFRSFAYEQQFGDSLGLAQSMINLGILAGKLGFYSESVEYLRNAMEFLDPHSPIIYMALVQQNLGLTLHWQGEPSEALENLYQAREIYLEIADSQRLYQLETDIVNVLIETGQLDKASQILNNGYKGYENKLNLRSTLMRNMSRMNLAMKESNFTKAKLIWENRLLPYKNEIQETGFYRDWILLNVKLCGMEGDLDEMILWTEKLSQHDYESRQIAKSVALNEIDLEASLQVNTREGVAISNLGNLRNTTLLVIASIAAALLVFILLAVSVKEGSHNDLIEPTRLIVNEHHNHEERSDEYRYERLFKRVEACLIQDERFRDTNCNMRAIAKELGTNISYLSKAVNQGSGLNFRTYLNKLRVESAKKELIQSNGTKSIAQVGFEVGYKSPSVFSRVFKEHTGYSPKDWVN